MINVNKDFGANNIGPEFVIGENHCQYLFLYDCTVLLSFIQCTSFIINSLELLVMSLTQYYSNSEITCITHYLKRFILIWYYHDGNGNQSRFELLKCLQACLIKIKIGILFHNLHISLAIFEKILCKSSIKPNVSKEASHSLYCGWWHQTLYSKNLTMVNLKTF